MGVALEKGPPLLFEKKIKIMVDLLDIRLYTVSITIRNKRAK